MNIHPSSSPAGTSGTSATATTSVKDTSPEALRSLVRERYGEIAQGGGSCCGPKESACCSSSATSASVQLGYGVDELASVPDGADLGLGCGNPTALASLQPGEVVVDLGSGGGLDAFLAAEKVGERGRVIGVDMTPAMLARARANAVKAGVEGYVEFREGIIEALPIVSDSVDVIISNCVINLSPDKPQVYREAFRVLKSGGRLAVSDIVLSQPLPPEIATLAAGYTACLSGADTEEDTFGAMRDAGFVDIAWTRVPAAPLLLGSVADPVVQEAIAQIGMERALEVAKTVWSYKITAHKP